MAPCRPPIVYGMCLPFEVGIHLLPLVLLETTEERLREFMDKRGELVESLTKGGT